MSLPLATTTITVERRNNAEEATQDPWDEGYADAPVATAFQSISSGVPAVITGRGGRATGPGVAEVAVFTLLCDPIDLGYLDRVIDETTGQTYEVEWAVNSPGVAGNLSSTKAGLITRKGA